MQEKKLLRDALEGQLVRWYSLPAGVDEEADELDTSPDDMDAHIAGLAVREINEALAATTEETEMEKLVTWLKENQEYSRRSKWADTPAVKAVIQAGEDILDYITTQFG